MIYELFPIKLYEYKLNDQLLNDQILQYLESETFLDVNSHIPDNIKSYQTNHYLHQNEKYKPLINWFETCLTDYIKKEELDCDDLKMTVCWANKYPKFTQSHHLEHSHRMSYVSAVYYFTEGAPTFFNDPLVQRTQNSLEVHNNNPRQAYIEAVPGSLILFPSWLPHGTIPHQSMKDRWTISFNTMPVGNINQNSNNSGNPSCILDVK